MFIWLTGLAGSLLISGLAYWKRSLSFSGMLAAVIVGTILYALGSLFWFGLILVFFITSTLLTRWKKHRKAEAENVYQKGGRRDAGQVFANGGIGAILCALSAAWPEAVWLPALYVGITATVTADTWATEIGSLSKSEPRFILSGKRVPRGTSGGVTMLGQSAALAGASVIGLAAWSFLHMSSSLSGKELLSHGWSLLILAALSGWAGANLDSLLGAAIQAVYRCPVCGRVVESTSHCGHQTLLLRGWRRMDNDAVNIVSSVGGGVIFALIYIVISQASA